MKYLEFNLVYPVKSGCQVGKFDPPPFPPFDRRFIMRGS